MNNASTKEFLENYTKYHAQDIRGIIKKGVTYIGNLNEYDGMYYWSPITDMDILAFVSSDKYGKCVIA